jgi:hypothetical protein
MNGPKKVGGGGIFFRNSKTPKVNPFASVN